MITTFQSIKLYLKFAECRKLKPILSNYSFLPVMLFYNRIILILILVQNIAGRNPSKEISVPEAGNKRVTEIIKNFKGRGTLADDTPPTPPEKAVKEFKVREGFAIELMASEPEVQQPLHLSWDSRGRLWVSQYLQYQFPAGLKIVEYDNHLRAQFDKLPKPPPFGVKGLDKITVHEDTDGDGFFDLSKEVISGLNISTAVVNGHGGIWVANPPYLLFYADKDKDDIPDSDPEVRLSGFGLEDTHSVMNSLEWGPDGWLYGVNGSTTTGKVKCPATGRLIEWQGQMIWRHHPETKHFEIYAEGGGNTFSLEIDSKGRVFSGTNSGNTRGMHYPQGSYARKNWGKHGPLTNPYAFGFFEHMKNDGDRRRFAQAFCIYDGGIYPQALNGRIIAANSLHNLIWVSDLRKHSSGFHTIDETNLLDSGDRWFRPVFSGFGPDGCVYIADWYDTRLSHVRPVDDWHKASGRIYRIKPQKSKPVHELGDLAKMQGQELINLLGHSNRWIRRRAVLEIGWRKIEHLTPSLINLVKADAGQKSLEALWALNLLNGISEEDSLKWIEHPDPHIRRWMVRLLGDDYSISSRQADSLAILSKEEKDPEVLLQLAASAKRFKANHGLEILKFLAQKDPSTLDERLPLMIWWGMEAHCESGRKILMEWCEDGDAWTHPVFRNSLAQRLIRRYAMTGDQTNLNSCADLLQSAPDRLASNELLTGIRLAFEGTIIPPLPTRLIKRMNALTEKKGTDSLLMEVMQGNKKTLADAIKLAGNPSTETIKRLELIKIFGTIQEPSVIDYLLKNLGSDHSSAVKRISLLSLGKYNDPRIPRTILSRHDSTLPAEHGVRSTAHRVLASRLEWARQFLEKVDQAYIKGKEVSPDVVQLLMEHKDSYINHKVSIHWPDHRALSSISKQAEMDRIRKIVTGAKNGDSVAGKAHFVERCAFCHKLFGEGGSTAPDLTGYERKNLDFWLHGIIDPNLEIREGYLNYVVRTKDKRLLTGVIIEENRQILTLRDAVNQQLVVPKSNIDKLEASKTSLMPEGLLGGLNEEEIRNLFAFLSK